jgi:uncharacterized membrane protein
MPQPKKMPISVWLAIAAIVAIIVWVLGWGDLYTGTD